MRCCCCWPLTMGPSRKGGARLVARCATALYWYPAATQKKNSRLSALRPAGMCSQAQTQANRLKEFVLRPVLSVAWVELSAPTLGRSGLSLGPLASLCSARLLVPAQL